MILIEGSSYGAYVACMFFVISLAIGTFTYSGTFRPGYWRQIAILSLLAVAVVMISIALAVNAFDGSATGYLTASFVLLGLVFLLGGWQGIREPLLGLFYQPTVEE